MERGGEKKRVFVYSSGAGLIKKTGCRRKLFCVLLNNCPGLGLWKGLCPFNSSNTEKLAYPVSTSHIPKGDVFNSLIIERSVRFKFNVMEKKYSLQGVPPTHEKVEGELDELCNLIFWANTRKLALCAIWI